MIQKLNDMIDANKFMEIFLDKKLDIIVTIQRKNIINRGYLPNRRNS